MTNSRHWDLVISCFEPIAAVTGGIGTYTRLLLDLLSRARNGSAPRILFFTSARHAADDPPRWDGVATELVPEEVLLDGLLLNNLVDPQRHFGFGLMTRLRELQAAGHTFGLLEVPDYLAEGYYTLKARAYGLLRIDTIAVRLHSPATMLYADNQEVGHRAPTQSRVIGEERYVYRLADRVLFGGDAMLARIAALLPEAEREAFVAKAVKVPHPWPPATEPTRPSPHDSRLQIGYVGRLEYRKGVDLLVRAAVRLLERDPTTAVFHFFGRDTMTHRVATDTYPPTYSSASMLAWLETLIPERLRTQFVFHGYTSQAELCRTHLPAMDAFVFPSRFENYPNVLLETLPLGRPILVSRDGCMPEIAAGFPAVTAFDPTDEPVFVTALAALIRQGRRGTDTVALYRSTEAAVAERIREAYEQLSRPRPVPPPSGPPPALPLAVVVPHFNQARWLPALFASIRPQLEPGDEVVVVDDASSPEEAGEARRLTEAAGWRFLPLSTNQGPSAARNAGARTAGTDLLYFVDADDELVPRTVEILRRAMRDHPDLDVVSGFLQAFGDEHHCWASYDPSVGTILREHSSHCGVLVRRATFERVGGYQQAARLRHWEDWELHIRLVLHGARFEIVPVLTYRYRVDKTRGRNSVDLDRIFESHAALLRSALADVPPARLQAIWPEIAALLVDGLLKQPSTTPVVVVPELLRYKVVDSLNELMRRTPLHGPLKRVLGWRWRLAPPP